MPHSHDLFRFLLGALSIGCRTCLTPSQSEALDQNVSLEQATCGPHHERRGLGIIRMLFQPYVQTSRRMLDPQIGRQWAGPDQHGG
jgi:hypothetical protein